MSPVKLEGGSTDRLLTEPRRALINRREIRWEGPGAPSPSGRSGRGQEHLVPVGGVDDCMDIDWCGAGARWSAPEVSEVFLPQLHSPSSFHTYLLPPARPPSNLPSSYPLPSYQHICLLINSFLMQLFSLYILMAFCSRLN